MNEKIRRFARQMQMELDHNLHKGNIFEWEDLQEKLLDLEYHKAKLLLAIKEKKPLAIKEYIADCANILLSIGNEYELYEEDPMDDWMESVMVDDSIIRCELNTKPRKSLLRDNTSFY